MEWTEPSLLCFSHMRPVFTSVIVPSPLSVYASAAPFCRSPSWPVPAHGITVPVLSQQVVCPVAGNGQPAVSVVVVVELGVVLVVVGGPARGAHRSLEPVLTSTV